MPIEQGRNTRTEIEGEYVPRGETKTGTIKILGLEWSPQWGEISSSLFLKPIKPFEPYTEPFRPINLSEMHCIQTSCQRNRIPWTYPLADTPANLIQVSFSCNSAGFTQCVILCQHESNTYLFLGVCKLLPTDSFDKVKGQKLAFYRAVVGEESMVLPVGAHFALAE
jgi:hypothetical protein